MQQPLNILKEGFIKAVFSNPHKLSSDGLTRAIIRPILIKGDQKFQITLHKKEKDFHNNVSKSSCMEIIDEFLKYFKNIHTFNLQNDFQIQINRKGELKIKSMPPTQHRINFDHNKSKKHILSDDKPIDFLIELSIMNKNGKIYPHRMSKFRQINRFLELVTDVLSAFNDQKDIHIVDFGCGKAYLTFALYHYLREILGLNVTMTGVDIKNEVIDECNEIAEKCHYHNLHFASGDISNYLSEKSIDIVIALHACDTATDDAIAKGISWNAKAIFAAPCCQHELYNQIDSAPLQGFLQYGILKERFASLTTDAARALLLEIHGYNTQIIEFIDSEHTPKNLLIRATLGNSQNKRIKAKEDYNELKSILNIRPYLDSLLT